MANNSSIIYDRLLQSALVSLQNSVPGNIGYIIVGVFNTITNLLIVLTIIIDKQLKSRCYFLIANSSIAAIIFALAWAATSIKREIRWIYQVPEIMTKEVCIYELFFCLYGQAATVYVPMTVAIDRLLSTVIPVTYKFMKMRSAVLSALIAWMISLIETIVVFYVGNNIRDMVSWCNINGVTLLWDVQYLFEVAISVLNTLVYFYISFRLHRQYSSSATNGSDQVTLIHFKRKLKVIKVLGIDSVIHLLTQIGGRLLTQYATLITNTPGIYGPFFRMISITGNSTTLFIFLIFNADFRAAYKRTFKFCFRRVTVAPSTSLQMSRLKETTPSTKQNVLAAVDL